MTILTTYNQFSTIKITWITKENIQEYMNEWTNEEGKINGDDHRK